MLLIGVKENNGWLLSRWQLTYAAGWEQICKAAAAVMEYYDGLQILVDDEIVPVSSKEEVMALEESRALTFRGFSKIVKCPIMITFFNQLNAVDVNVPKDTEEFASPDYQAFNMSLCQYLDSMELAMHR